MRQSKPQSLSNVAGSKRLVQLAAGDYAGCRPLENVQLVFGAELPSACLGVHFDLRDGIRLCLGHRASSLLRPLL